MSILSSNFPAQCEATPTTRYGYRNAKIQIKNVSSSRPARGAALRVGALYEFTRELIRLARVLSVRLLNQIVQNLQAPLSVVLAVFVSTADDAQDVLLGIISLIHQQLDVLDRFVAQTRNVF